MIATSGTVVFSNGDEYKTYLLDVEPGVYMAMETSFTATLESADYMGIGGEQ